LGLRERRAVVFFVQGKTSSERAKVLQVFADKAPQFAALACKLVAIWPRSKAAEAGSARRTSQSSDVAFCLTDESDILTTAFGFAKEDSADCSRARSACVVDASGSIVGVAAAAVATEARAAVALRLLVSHDNAVEKEEARQAALRAQALFAAANRRARMGSFQNARADSATTIYAELEREARAAADRMRAASAKKRTAEADMARADVAGDEIVLRSAASLVQEAAAEELHAAHDHLWMTRKQVDTLRSPLNQLRQAAAKADREAADVSRRAHQLRAKLTGDVIICGLRAERLRSWVVDAEERRAEQEERRAEASAVRAAETKDRVCAAEGELQAKLKIVEASRAQVQELSEAAHGRRSMMCGQTSSA
jgi:peroxiredoxin